MTTTTPTRTPPDAPADTRLMGIIHDAFRRDLGRAVAALSGDRPPGDRQRRAIAAHIRWMMEFLEAHHHAEDDGLYPMVCAADPSARTLLDEMHAEHTLVAPALADALAAADAYATNAIGPAPFCAALERLGAVLLPHLRREEDEAMPVVAAAITQGELMAWDQAANIKPKTARQLAREGHWIIDAASADDRARVLQLVGPVQRFVLVHGFARAYRRRRDRCWGRPVRRVQKHAAVEVVVVASPEAVVAIVHDVTRVGEWSRECVGATWLGGATAAAPGVRFRGRNRNGRWAWGRLCEVLEVSPSGIAWKTVPTRLFPDSCEWRIDVQPHESGARIVQSFRVLVAPRLLDPVYATLVPSHRDRCAELAGDLRRLGNIAAGSATPPAEPTS